MLRKQGNKKGQWLQKLCLFSDACLVMQQEQGETFYFREQTVSAMAIL